MTITSDRQTAVVGKLSNVNKFYGNRRILDDISLEVRANEIVALVGRSGCGKSTVLRVLAGLSDDHAGNREVSGAPAVAFQEPRLFPWRDVLTNVQYGLTRTTLSREAARARSERALAEIGLTDHAQSWPLTLSGGQAQRVSLARALVRSPALLLLDEPFSALDALTTISMHRLVLRLWETHRPAVLLVTHDVDEALALADRVLVLGAGRIAYSATVDAPRPRDRNHPELSALRLRLLSELGVPMGDTDELT